MAEITINVPEIVKGEETQLPVVDVLVAVGETVVAEQSLLTLESDKALIEIPSPSAGRIRSIKVNPGDTVVTGQTVIQLETADDGAEAVAKSAISSATASVSPVLNKEKRAGDAQCQLVVIGGGPGGYTAAFRAADLGLDVILVERYPDLGGVCLNVGCIPSKALLHAAEVIDAAAHASAFGIEFGQPKIDQHRLRQFKEQTVKKLTGGLAQMAKQRKVRLIQGEASVSSPHTLSIQSATGQTTELAFAQCILAAGSRPVRMDNFPWDDQRVMDSTRALALEDIPASLLVVGAGIIGLEMATVYAALGSRVTVVEYQDQIIPGADQDVVKPLLNRLKRQGIAIHCGVKAGRVTPKEDGILVNFESAAATGKGTAPQEGMYARVLVAVGRTPNSDRLALDKAGIHVGERGYIPVDRQMRTNIDHFFAIGDLTGNPMLAHKATHEGKLAAEVAAGQSREWVSRVIPSVAYTNPEIAWVGMTETQAKSQGVQVGVATFPWSASGRAIGSNRTEGMTKLLFDEKTQRIVGGAIVGLHAGEILAEICLAIEMGAHVADLTHTIHAHPTLSESVAMAAELFDGTITDLYLPPAERRR